MINQIPIHCSKINSPFDYAKSKIYKIYSVNNWRKLLKNNVATYIVV